MEGLEPFCTLVMSGFSQDSPQLLFSIISAAATSGVFGFLTTFLMARNNQLRMRAEDAAESHHRAKAAIE
jgi:hypothetical protein